MVCITYDNASGCLFETIQRTVSLKGKCIWEGTQWAIMFLLVYQGIFHFGKLDAQHSMKQDYLLRTEQWDLVISEFNHDVLSKRRMCGLNLALAHKGSFQRDC